MRGCSYIPVPTGSKLSQHSSSSWLLRSSISGYINMQLQDKTRNTWRFPEMGVPHVSSIYMVFSIRNHPASLGYPHGYGKLHMNNKSQVGHMFHHSQPSQRRRPNGSTDQCPATRDMARTIKGSAAPGLTAGVASNGCAWQLGLRSVISGGGAKTAALGWYGRAVEIST